MQILVFVALFALISNFILQIFEWVAALEQFRFVTWESQVKPQFLIQFLQDAIEKHLLVLVFEFASLSDSLASSVANVIVILMLKTDLDFFTLW